MALSLPSRLFSSATLMDGELLVSNQNLDAYGDDELLAELKLLEASIS